MIERLYVQNFRCLESVTLDFAGTPSALIIGNNGAGKSTTLHALSVFQSICRGSSRVGTLIVSADFSFLHIDRPMRFEIEVSLTGKHFKYAISFDWPDTFREARILDESLSVDGQAIFTRHHAQVQLPGGGNFGLDWHVFALPVINERPPGRAIQDLKAFFASIVLIAPNPTEMSGFSEQPSVELEHDASNFASCLRSLLVRKPAVYSALDAYVREVIPDFSSIDHEDRGKDGQQLMVNFKRPDADESLRVEFDALSDGEKCFFLSGYIVASNATGFPVVCMWDEPDNHLSLSQVGQFITGLRKMANRGGQFIATSHHPETVRKFSDDNTFVLTRKTHLDPSLPKLLKDFSYSGDLINALIRDEIIG
ncbi:MAG TPA: AAA family ATPase [Tepidisphaeraceae bacterium]|jgi:ABC-type cobalamin/Fe3+-siderophores transport system ATPase subunit|nr:AAA family ATPase [Tepidisphaeraceae bacterium]